MARNRDNIVIVKLDRPNLVTLPNGRTFFCKIQKSWRKCATKQRDNKKNIQKKRKKKRPEMSRIWKLTKKRFNLC